jgi:hypothetical protein
MYYLGKELQALLFIDMHVSIIISDFAKKRTEDYPCMMRDGSGLIVYYSIFPLLRR